jgi:hypothetical protein
MGHHINALLGTSEALKNFGMRLGMPVPTKLSFGLVIIPLDEQRLDAIAMSVEPTIAGFTYLTPCMAQEIAVTARGPALYIETDYFGGMGSQSAAYFENGGLRWWGAESSEEALARSSLAELYQKTASGGKSPINEGLSRLGVGRSETRDEFDEIGLQRFTSLEALGIEHDD